MHKGFCWTSVLSHSISNLCRLVFKQALGVWLSRSSADTEMAQLRVGGVELGEVQPRHSLHFPPLWYSWSSYFLHRQAGSVILNIWVEDNILQNNSTVIPKDGITNSIPSVLAAGITLEGVKQLSALRSCLYSTLLSRHVCNFADDAARRHSGGCRLVGCAGGWRSAAAAGSVPGAAGALQGSSGGQMLACRHPCIVVACLSWLPLRRLQH